MVSFAGCIRGRVVMYFGENPEFMRRWVQSLDGQLLAVESLSRFYSVINRPEVVLAVVDQGTILSGLSKPKTPVLELVISEESGFASLNLPGKIDPRVLFLIEPETTS